MELEDLQLKYEKVPVTEYGNSVCANPLVSVCIQTYQHADYIRDCLDGILMQKTDFEIEILLGDDYSTDGTRDICIEYAKNHRDKIRFFMHRRENNIKIAGSPSGRFNFLYNLCRSKGTYIAICEGDDYWTDIHKLQKQVKYMETHPDAVMTYHKYLNVDAKGNVLSEKKKFLPCTAMFVNSIGDLPDMKGCPNGDRFLHTFFLLKGEIKYIDNISHSVRRLHSGGVMSMQNKDVKLERQVLTWSSIYNAFKNTPLRKDLYRKRNKYIYQKLLLEFDRSARSILQLVWFPISTLEFRLYKSLIKKLVVKESVSSTATL